MTSSKKGTPSSRRLVVTGAGGMLGQELVPRLLAAGHEVVALDKSQGFLRVLSERAPAAAIHVADLADAGAWMDLFKGADTVLDLKAQITSTERALHERNNTAATLKVLEACEKHGIRHLIHMSSSVVISVAKDLYTETKRAGEEAVRASRIPHTIFRPPLMVGPGDIKHLGLILRMMKVLPIVPLPGASRFIRQPLYVGDMASVLIKSLDREPRGEVFNVIGHERITFVDLLREIRRVTRTPCVFIPVPLPVFRLALRAHIAILPKPIFTMEQLEALTAGDDFPVEGWSDVFGVPFTPFLSVSPRIYTDGDDLRVKLLAAQAQR